MSVISDFISAGGSGGSIPKRQLFTANGTWTKPTNILGDTVWVTMIGGGSSGNSSNSGLGGCSGQFFIRLPLDVSATSSVPVTVGSGGANVTANGTDQAGNAGESSSFGAFLTAVGGTAPGATDYYVGEVSGNPGKSEANSNGVVNPIPHFGASPPYMSRSTSAPGGSGLLLDDSGISGDDSWPSNGSSGYGAGGAGTAANSQDGLAGVQGAVMIEWIESL